MLRIVIAVLLGYALIGGLIWTDQLYAHLIPGVSPMATPPTWYFLLSMATDTIYTLIGGWLCARISRSDIRATLGLIILGEVMAIASTVYLWNNVPHFYGFYLLIMYPPAIWFGAKRYKTPMLNKETQS